MKQNKLNKTSGVELSAKNVNTENQQVNAQTMFSDKHVENLLVKETSEKEPETIMKLNLEPEQKEIQLSDAGSEAPTMDIDVSYIDYSGLTKYELIQKFKQLLSECEITYLKNDVENIKINFLKKHKAENEERRKKFIEDGGVIEEYTAKDDPLEEEFKQLYKDYRERRSELGKFLEEQKIQNLKLKYEIIESIKELINKPESLQHTFEEFHLLQNKWKQVGFVPQKEVKQLYDSFEFTVQNFYDWVKLNNEARDMDLCRNLDAKIELCEKVESLLLETNIRKAFGELQVLHERWREIGPVLPDKKEEIWIRFHEATSKIHKIHQEYYLKKKEELEGNLNAKTILCEKAEEIASKIYTHHKEWEKTTKDFIELQQVWKTIGRVPKTENNAIFKRFKDANERFFSAKKEYYRLINEDENNNLQLKTDLCLKAESIKDSSDWKKTTNDFINLQKEWKKIGQVPRRISQEIWNRFKVACNDFFERRAAHFSTINDLLEENFMKKEQLLESIEKYQFTENSDEDLKNLKQFQKEWVEIGHVPENKKINLNNHYRQAINKSFDSLKVDDKKKENIKFKIHIENILKQQNAHDRLKMEREKLIKKLNQIEAELKVLENNIGFFSKSNNSDILLKDFSSKIETAKKEAAIIKEHVKYLDSIKKD